MRFLSVGYSLSFCLFIFASNVSAAYLTKYCASTVFRETPFADIRCANEISASDARNIKHFQFDFDKDKRLIEVRYQLGTKLLPYSDRFVRASKTKISYHGNNETRFYFNEFDLPTLVSGDVYRSEFKLDEKGKRRALDFYGVDGKRVNNDFGIANYTWERLDNGQIVEKRKNKAGELVRNRPGFGYLVTRFAYDSDGLLTKMYNLGVKGEMLTEDDAGVAMTKISYSSNGQFTQWLNLDLENEPRRGMSDIAEIIYEPSAYRGEKEAYFFGPDGKPQTTRWGAHRVSYQFDGYGNEVQVEYYDIENRPVESSSGISSIRSRYSKDGTVKFEDAYFDKHGKKVASSYSGVHKILTRVDDKQRPSRRIFLDVQEQVCTHAGLGYAQEVLEYDNLGGVSKRVFLDASNKLVNHETWGVASFEYQRSNTGELVNVIARNAVGVVKTSQWDPEH